MAKLMEGVVIKGVNEPYEVVDNLPIPTPGEGQVLVKSIATAINPVETFMSTTGLLTKSFPIALGCDASGIVVSCGPSSVLKEGDRICGCTRLGFPGHGTFQQYFLMDDAFVIRPPDHISYTDAATIGVGCQTACIGLLQGIGLKLEDEEASPLKTGEEEWVVVMGGAGSVGQFSIKISKALGYHVLATCGKRSAELVKNVGADATVDYSQSEEVQFEQIKEVTKGKFFGVSGTCCFCLSYPNVIDAMSV